jgi:hypothetical protein
LIDSEYLSRRAENNHHARKRGYEAQRDEQRPRATGLSNGRAEKYWQNRQCAGSGNRQGTGEQSDNSGQYRAQWGLLSEG